jgi:hypothetical protein
MRDRETRPARTHRPARLLCGALLLLLNGCLADPPTPVPGPATPAPPAPTAPAVFTPPAAGQVLIGTWASGDFRLTANRFGAAMAFRCAEGGLKQPLQVDAQGRFDVTGEYAWKPGEPMPTYPVVNPARYQGQIISSTMLLTITISYTEPDTITYRLPFVSAEPTYVPPRPCA